jgi:transposase
MMGWQTGDQRQLFYLFNLERRIPASHLLRRINPIVIQVLADLREKLAPFYSDIGRPSIDPELMIRMLIVGYCYGIRFERRLCEEVELHLAYRRFCRLDLDDKVPDHSTFSVNRHGDPTRTLSCLGVQPWGNGRTTELLGSGYRLGTSALSPVHFRARISCHSASLKPDRDENMAAP